MSEQYGEFLESALKLDGALAEVRVVWTDQTAMTFDKVNDNMEFFFKKIVATKENAISTMKVLKSNYNEDEIDDIVHKLNMDSNMV